MNKQEIICVLKNKIWELRKNNGSTLLLGVQKGNLRVWIEFFENGKIEFITNVSSFGLDYKYWEWDDGNQKIHIMNRRREIVLDLKVLRVDNKSYKLMNVDKSDYFVNHSYLDEIILSDWAPDPNMQLQKQVSLNKKTVIFIDKNVSRKKVISFIENFLNVKVNVINYEYSSVEFWRDIYNYLIDDISVGKVVITTGDNLNYEDILEIINNDYQISIKCNNIIPELLIGNRHDLLEILSNLSFKCYLKQISTNKVDILDSLKNILKSNFDFKQIDSSLIFQLSRKQINKKNKVESEILISEFIMNAPDAQRANFEASEEEFILSSMTLAKSAYNHNVNGYVLVNNKIKDSENGLKIKVGVEPKELKDISLYFRRWIMAYLFLLDHPETEKVALVDLGDVEILFNFFDKIKSDFLYIGDELEKLDVYIVKEGYVPRDAKKFLTDYNYLQLLNPGLIAGTREVVLEYLGIMANLIAKAVLDEKNGAPKLREFDMGMINYIAYRYFPTRIRHGRRVSTIFQTYLPDPRSWIRHK